MSHAPKTPHDLLNELRTHLGVELGTKLAAELIAHGRAQQKAPHKKALTVGERARLQDDIQEAEVDGG